MDISGLHAVLRLITFNSLFQRKRVSNFDQAPYFFDSCKHSGKLWQRYIRSVIQLNFDMLRKAIALWKFRHNLPYLYATFLVVLRLLSLTLREIYRFSQHL